VKHERDVTPVVSGGYETPASDEVRSPSPIVGSLSLCATSGRALLYWAFRRWHRPTVGLS